MIAIIFTLFALIFSYNAQAQRTTKYKIYKPYKNTKIKRVQRTNYSSNYYRGGKSTYQLERRVFNLINKQRARRGLRRLVWNSRLAAVARKHSNDMARYNFFSHTGRDGRNASQRAKSFGIRGWRGIGENVAYNKGFGSPAQSAVNTWMNSSGHRYNLLHSRWQETGIGVAVSRDGKYYFTEVFLMR